MPSSPFIRVVPQRGKHDDTTIEHTTWRHVGWIFREGETLTIERCGRRSSID